MKPPALEDRISIATCFGVGRGRALLYPVVTMTNGAADDFSLLGHESSLPASPDEAKLDTFANKSRGRGYSVTLDCPEFIPGRGPATRVGPSTVESVGPAWNGERPLRSLV